jgi:hypothetical protein
VFIPSIISLWQINALKGKKVVSTSRTPGHTKWRQTIFLSPKLVLQDCPGLVFPALDVPKQLQVLCGIYPLSQLREPYSAVHYLAERVPVEEIYRLEKVDPNEPWSGWHICQAYAKKRGYRTRRGNFDGHRAGIEILKDVWDGRIVLYFLPYQTHINLHNYLDNTSPSTSTSTSTSNNSTTTITTTTTTNNNNNKEIKNMKNTISKETSFECKKTISNKEKTNESGENSTTSKLTSNPFGLLDSD